MQQSLVSLEQNVRILELICGALCGGSYNWRTLKSRRSAATLHLFFFGPWRHLVDSCVVLTGERVSERSRRREKLGRVFCFVLKKKHLVFTGGGPDAAFLGGGEGGDDGGEDHVWALGGVDGRVKAASAVVRDQRDGLAVVGVQAGAQRGLVVVAAADERLASYLSRRRK